MSFTDVLRGVEDEDALQVRLRAAGWGCTPFGSRMWAPETAPTGYGDETLERIVNACQLPLRNAPDLLAADSDNPRPVFIEVIRNGYDNGRVAMNVPKLAALTEWARIAPVIIVDMGHETWWWHRAGWPWEVIGDVRAGIGSPQPWAIFLRTRERDLKELLHEH
jgi:hypothetical protein